MLAVVHDTSSTLNQQRVNVQYIPDNYRSQSLRGGGVFAKLKIKGAFLHVAIKRVLLSSRSANNRATILVCKAERQWMLTLKVGSYCLFGFVRQNNPVMGVRVNSLDTE